jgi:hypothetical protein
LSQRTLLIASLGMMAAGLLLSVVGGPLLEQPTAAVNSQQQIPGRHLAPGFPGGRPGGGFYGHMPGRIPHRPNPAPSPSPAPNA